MASAPNSVVVHKRVVVKLAAASSSYTSYTTRDGEIVLADSTADAFLVNLPVGVVPAGKDGNYEQYPATQSSVVVGTTGPQSPVNDAAFVGAEVTVVNILGTNGTTIKTTDGSTILDASGAVTGSTGVVLDDADDGVTLVMAGDGNWYQVAQSGDGTA